MKTKKPREVRHRIRCTDLGLVVPEGPDTWPFYRERFETRCKGKILVIDADVPKMTVVNQVLRDAEAHSTLALLRDRLKYILKEKAVIHADVVLKGNRKGLYWTVRR